MGLRTFLQLTHEVLRSVNSPVQKATVFDAQQAINDSYRDLCQHYNWPWLLDRYDIALEAPYTTGTISVAIGSTTVTGVGTAWNFAAGAAGWWNKKLLLTPNNVGLEIVQFNSATQLTLRFPFTAGAAVVNSGYQVYQDDYPTPVISGHDMVFSNPQWLMMRINKVDSWTMVDKTQFQPFLAVQGPQMVADSGADWNTLSPTYNQPRFRFWPIPNSAQIITMQYYKIPVPLALDADLTILPPEFEEILIKTARFRIKQRFGIQGWMEDQRTAAQALIEFKNRQATAVALDQQVGGGNMRSAGWDPWAFDESMGFYPGHMNP